MPSARCRLGMAAACRRAALLAGLLIGTASAEAEEIRVDLDLPGDPHVTGRIGPDGFAFEVALEGKLDKLEPAWIRIHTRQQGRWNTPKLDTGRYLTGQFDPGKPTEIRLKSTLVFDLESGERRYGQERDRVGREAQRLAQGKDKGARTAALWRLLRERIAAIRKENIEGRARLDGRAARTSPPLPRRAGDSEKVESLERILKRQCVWQNVADVLRSSGFPPPDAESGTGFNESRKFATEIHQAVQGIGAKPQFLRDSQKNALIKGHQYSFTATFVPKLSSAEADLLWKTAPAVRLADGLVRQARLEGSLDRRRGRTVQWWRVECNTPKRIEADMIKGGGDCFWRWIDGPKRDGRYIRVMLHNPGTRYRLKLTLRGATKGDAVIVYDGPLGAPTKGPF